MDTIKECGGHSGEALGGIIIDDATDVAVDAEDLLNDDDGRLGGSGRLRDICTKGMTVGSGELDVRAHGRSLQFLVRGSQCERGVLTLE